MTKDERKAKLQEVGQWDAFILLRDELKGEGMPGGEAGDCAFNEIMSAFKSKQSEETEPQLPFHTDYFNLPESAENLESWARGEDDDSREAMPTTFPLCDQSTAQLWAFKHANTLFVEPRSAPSRDAWELRIRLRNLLIKEATSRS